MTSGSGTSARPPSPGKATTTRPAGDGPPPASATAPHPARLDAPTTRDGRWSEVRGAWTDGGDGRLAVRVLLRRDVPVHLVLDTDDDRTTGMWTYQSPVAASGWDALVDASGATYAHAGPPTVWSWTRTGSARRTVTGAVVDV